MQTDFFGVIIERGPQDWQVVGQENGAADIPLSGRLCYGEPLDGSERILARIVDENTGVLLAPPVSTPLLPGKRWELTLKDVPAGGLYRIETLMRYGANCEKIGERIHHIGVGDVYLIAGQSNAQGVGKDTVYDPCELGIHMLRQTGAWAIAAHPLGDGTGTVFPKIRAGSQIGHSPWLNFARTLKNTLHYPIGLIPAALGGTPLSRWNPEEEGDLYRNMLDMAAAAGSEIRGILWYHGCNDANPDDCGSYYERFCRMVSHLRGDFGDVPILTVQLNKATCVKGGLHTNDPYWSQIREAQRRAAVELPGVYIVPTADLSVCDGIHNRAADNLTIGERAGKLALRRVYGKTTLGDAPMIAAAEKRGATITARFDHVTQRLNTDLVPVERFALQAEDENGPLPLADYSGQGGEITLMFGRDVGKEAFLSCAAQQYNHGALPYDVDSYLPVIPFTRFPVK